MTPQRRPTRVPGIELRTTGAEVLVHDTLKNKVHVLNVTAGRIYALCDGEHDVDAIVDALVAEWGIDRSTALTDVHALLADFAARGLLAEPG